MSGKEKGNDLPKPPSLNVPQSCLYLGRRFAQKIQRRKEKKMSPAEGWRRNIVAEAGKILESRPPPLFFSQL